MSTIVYLYLALYLSLIVGPFASHAATLIILPGINSWNLLTRFFHAGDDAAAQYSSLEQSSPRRIPKRKFHR